MQNLKKYQFILFDLDGTLTDPGTGITNSVLFALNKMGIPENDRQKLRTFIGPPLAESFEKNYALSSKDAWQAVQYYREYFKVKGMFENVVYPGVSEMLRKLKNAGKSMWVATSKPTVYSEQILDHFKLIGFFESIVGSNLDGTRVNKTEVIEYLLNSETKIFPKNAVMIGDRMHDIVGAKNNEIDSIGVTYGYGSYSELKEAQATQIGTSVVELQDILLSEGIC